MPSERSTVTGVLCVCVTSHCRRLYIMTSTVSLCLSMKMINDPSLYDMLVHIRPFFIKYVAAAIRISYDVLL